MPDRNSAAAARNAKPVEAAAAPAAAPAKPSAKPAAKPAHK
eukprot:CAMPEP_0180327466 /NCGR_PEP_ID=MMETSP0988-20121125/39583_1 /TAXON_ID=697907 /ORGANISM="non described non described, Strain CCMP2293" /LENGTH=40 /DNA_ID= /DNA_START= /DNA_END= /DNA_ORIENTATION=